MSIKHKNTSPNKSIVKRTADFFKEDKSRYAIIAAIVITFILLGTTIFLSSRQPKDQWILWVSLISAIFGMINVTTYSIMDLEDEEKRNKYKIFILFNTIAVTTLAVVNIYSGLWILALENILFFFSGCYQFYNWFVVPTRNKKKGITNDKSSDNFVFSRINREDFFILAGGVILMLFFLTMKSSGWNNFNKISSPKIGSLEYEKFISFVDVEFGISFTELYGDIWFSMNTLWIEFKEFVIIRDVLDCLLGVMGMLGAFMVARKKFFAIWLYIVGNSALITMWGIFFILTVLPITSTGDNSLSNLANINPAQCINMVGLFVFYNTTNILLIKKWGSTLEPKT